MEAATGKTRTRLSLLSTGRLLLRLTKLLLNAWRLRFSACLDIERLTKSFGLHVLVVLAVHAIHQRVAFVDFFFNMLLGVVLLNLKLNYFGRVPGLRSLVLLAGPELEFSAMSGCVSRGNSLTASGLVHEQCLRSAVENTAHRAKRALWQRLALVKESNVLVVRVRTAASRLLAIRVACDAQHRVKRVSAFTKRVFLGQIGELKGIVLVLDYSNHRVALRHVCRCRTEQFVQVLMF